jgi:hypothetical protein
MAAPLPIFNDPEFWDTFFSHASGSVKPLKHIAEELMGVDFDSLYAKMRRTPALKERYDECCKARAQLHAAKVGDVLEKLETDSTFDTSRARELMHGHKWLASKMDRETFGDDKQPLVQVNFDSAGLNALRALAAAPVPTIEGEFTEVKSLPSEGEASSDPDLDALLS